MADLTGDLSFGEPKEFGPLPSMREAMPESVVSPGSDAHSELQSSVGNSLLAGMAAGGSPPDQTQPLSLQATHGNSAVARILIQRKAEGEASGAASSASETAASPATPIPTQALVVDDNAETLQPGQMKKTEFLTQLRGAVCITAADAFAGTPWTVASCPYIDRVFAHYATLNSQELERRIRRYAREAASATTAAALIPIVTARVRRSITTWVRTGEVTGVPEDVPLATFGAGMFGQVNTAVSAVASGVGEVASSVVSGIGSAVSSVGNLLFKERNGGAREASDPQAIQSQLGAGHALDGGLRSRMESAYGESFGDVQVHADANAAGLSENLNARAFTVGHHIAFAAGEYQPGTLIGDALVAHELAHVMQQRGNGTDVGSKEEGATSYDSLEHDADEAAVGAVISASAGRKGLTAVSAHAMPSLKSGLRLQRCGCSTPPPAPPTFAQYQDRFNTLWNTAPFNAMPPAAAGIDPTLPSRGPRTPKSRAIFDRIMATDPAMLAAYNRNTGGIRERIDTYVGPEGLNLIGSPRLTALHAAFAAHPKPVPAASFPALRGSVQAAAANLQPADRLAVERSNEWQRLINEYVTDDARRAEIRAIISPPAPAVPPPPGPGPPPAPAGPRGTPAQRTQFLNTWAPVIQYSRDMNQHRWNVGAVVNYVAGGQNFQVGAGLPAGNTNPGLTLFIKAQILRGAAIVAPAQQVQFPMDADLSPLFAMPVNAPAVVPAAGDPLTFKVEVLEPGAGGVMNVISTKNVAIRVMPEIVFTQAQAQALAVQDDTFFHDATPAGLLGLMTARGGLAANVAGAIAAGRMTLRPLTMRHDSAAYVTAREGAPNPNKVGYFIGTNYATSMVDVPGAAAFSIGAGNIVVNRTTDVHTNARRSNDEVIILTVHEAVHALDVRPDSGTDLERYKGEFRAYWMDGRYGPPNTAVCPVGAASCFDTTYNPNMPPPGPKSPRAREIFKLVYGSATYPFVKPAYDNNTGGFREAVDSYLIPDGINLIASQKLEALRGLIEGWNGLAYPAFRTSVQSYMGIGAPPAGGPLSADDKNEIVRNRAWRDLVERKVTDPAQQTEIKTILGIPR